MENTKKEKTVILRVLHNTDPQKAFVRGIGLNPVPNAIEAFKPMQKSIDNENYDEQIITLDTHTVKEYEGSLEQSIFKDIHCEFKTDGWMIDTIRTKSYEKFISFCNVLTEPFDIVKFGTDVYVTKNEFDVWTNPKFVQYVEENYDTSVTVIDVIGFALNYCVFDAVKGYVIRGFKVRVIQDATKPITTDVNGNEDETWKESIKWMTENGVIFIDQKDA